MGEEAEGIEVEMGDGDGVSAAAIAGDRRRRGRPKGRGNGRPKRRGKGRRWPRDNWAFASPAMRLGDEGRGVAAGTRVLRERRPASDAFYERDTDDDEVGD